MATNVVLAEIDIISNVFIDNIYGEVSLRDIQVILVVIAVILIVTLILLLLGIPIPGAKGPSGANQVGAARAAQKQAQESHLGQTRTQFLETLRRLPYHERPSYLEGTHPLQQKAGAGPGRGKKKAAKPQAANKTGNNPKTAKGTGTGSTSSSNSNRSTFTTDGDGFKVNNSNKNPKQTATNQIERPVGSVPEQPVDEEKQNPKEAEAAKGPWGVTPAAMKEFMFERAESKMKGIRRNGLTNWQHLARSGGVLGFARRGKFRYRSTGTTARNLHAQWAYRESYSVKCHFFVDGVTQVYYKWISKKYGLTKRLESAAKDPTARIHVLVKDSVF